MDEVTGTMVGLIKRLTVALADNNLEEIASVMNMFETRFAEEDQFYMVGMQREMVMDGAFASLARDRAMHESAQDAQMATEMSELMENRLVD